MFSGRAWVLLSGILFSTVSLTLAQDSAAGSMRGTVMDAGGGRISQASVVVVNNATGTRSVVTSDAEGRFALELSPGDMRRASKRKACRRKFRRNCTWMLAGQRSLNFD